jgi:ATP-binding cassette subfamily C protein
MLENLRILFNKRQRMQMSLVLAGIIVAALLEMVGLGAIPGFVSLLSNPDVAIEKLPQGAFRSWIRNTDLSIVTLCGAAFLAAIFAIKNVFIAGLIYAEGRVLRDVSSAIATRLFCTYVNSPYTFHLQRNPAELFRNVSTEVLQAMALVSSGMMIIREGLVLIVVFILLLILDPMVSLTAFLILGTAAAMFYLSIRRSLLERGRLAQSHRARQYKAVNQALGAIKDAKILGREPYLINQFRREVKGTYHHEFYARVAAALPRLFLEVLAVSSLVMVALLFVLLDRNMVSMLPVLALLAVGTVRLVPAFNAITSSLVRMRNQYPAMDLMCRELRELEHAANLRSAQNLILQKEERLQATIELKELHYTYPGAMDESLRGVSATIKARKAIGFIGPSGGLARAR